MTHPTSEEWMDYLYEELDARSQAKLAQHLEACDECRQAVAAWRGTMGKLDAWQIAQKRPRVVALGRAVRWAAAAVLLLAFGFAVGRLAGPDVEALRARLEPVIKQEVAEEVRTEWQAALESARAELREDLYGQLRGEMDELAAETFAASNAVTTSLLKELARSFDETRRSDLLALATLTEQEFLRTRRQMATALAYGPSLTPVSEAPVPSHSTP